MRGFVSGATMVLAGVLGVAAQTLPVYENDAPLVSPPMIAPQIDASVFINRSLFSVSNRLAYDFSNCAQFTNTSSGIMIGDPGFMFDLVTESGRESAAGFWNVGSISAATNLLVYASNVVSAGALSTGPGGLIRLHGSNLVDVSRSDLRTGVTPEFELSGGYMIGTNYVNDPGISDIYWGAGFNNVFLSTNAQGSNFGPGMLLVSGTNYSVPNFGVPPASSPLHQVEVFGFTNLQQAIVPDLGLSAGVPPGYDVLVYSQGISSNQGVIQLVFVPTNTPDPTVRTKVRFVTDPLSGRVGNLVEFSSAYRDFIVEQDLTNYLYLIDLTGMTNMVGLYRNTNAPTRRPSTMWVTRVTPPEWQFSLPTNDVFNSGMVASPFYATNRVDLSYAAYAARLEDPLTSRTTGTWPPVNPALLEPTNMPGRIEIQGGSVALEGARMRAESSVSIRTPNLIGNLTNSVIEAPFLLFDVKTPEPELVISNLLPLATVQRLSGFVYAWSGLWTNYIATATIIPPVPPATNSTIITNIYEFDINALVVDHRLVSSRPVVLDELGLHATNLVIGDNLTVGSTVQIEANNLHIVGGLTFPTNASWAVTNVHPFWAKVACTNVATGGCSNVIESYYPSVAPNLTNEGTISIPGVAYLGSDLYQYLPEPASTNCCSCGCRKVPLSYRNVVNRGSISASSYYIRSDYLENVGNPLVVGSGALNAFQGILSVEAQRALFSNCRVNGNGDVQIRANEASFNGNAVITTGFTNIPGALVMAVTNRLSDEGTLATNRWRVTAGFHFLCKPQIGDLLSTHIESRVERLNGLSTHTWAAEDRGAAVAGFSNNLALGWLRLDGVSNRTVFRFSGATSNRALYVDYLEFSNYATNFDRALEVMPGLQIYFANSNVRPEKLESHPSGRLHWVREYAGPNSSTNMVYPSGQTYTFNSALAQSRDLDSDGDGIVNANDSTPIFVGENVGLTSEFVSGPPPALTLTWNALADATNIVEYTTDLTAPQWQTATSVVGGYPTAPASVTVPASPARARFYRVRIQPAQ